MYRDSSCSLENLTKEDIAYDFRRIEESRGNPLLNEILNGRTTFCAEIQRFYDINYKPNYVLGAVKSVFTRVFKEDKAKIGISPQTLMTLLEKLGLGSRDSANLNYERVRKSMKMPLWNLSSYLTDVGVPLTACAGISSLILGKITGSEYLTMGGILTIAGPMSLLLTGISIEFLVQPFYKNVPKARKSLLPLKKFQKISLHCEIADDLVKRYNYLRQKGLSPQN